MASDGNATDGSERLTDGGRDPFFEVCEECGRHVVKAGHADYCPNDTDDTETSQEVTDE